MIKKWQERIERSDGRWPSNKEKVVAMEAEIKELRKAYAQLEKYAQNKHERANKWYHNVQKYLQKERDAQRRKAKQEVKKPVVTQASGLTHWIGGSPFH